MSYVYKKVGYLGYKFFSNLFSGVSISRLDRV